MPNGEYNGQKLKKLVIKKMIANAPRTKAKVPLIVLVKYKTAIATAIKERIILSVEPMFFFMIQRI